MKILKLGDFAEKLKIDAISLSQLDKNIDDIQIDNLFDNLFTFWTDSNNILDKKTLNTLQEKLPNEDCMLNILFDELHNKNKSDITDIPYFATNLEEPSEYKKLSNNEVMLSCPVLAVCFNQKLNNKQKEYFKQFGFNFDDQNANCTEFYEEQCYRGTNFYEIDYGIAEHFSYLKNKRFKVGDFISYVSFSDSFMNIDIHIIYNGDEDAIPVYSFEARTEMKNVITSAINYFNEETSKELQLMIDRNK